MHVKCGTVGYMAPEVESIDTLRVKEPVVVSPKIDVFSLGVCLYEMAVGYKPTDVYDYHYGKRTGFDKIRFWACPHLQDPLEG